MVRELREIPLVGRFDPVVPAAVGDEMNRHDRVGDRASVEIAAMRSRGERSHDGLSARVSHRLESPRPGEGIRRVVLPHVRPQSEEAVGGARVERIHLVEFGVQLIDALAGLDMNQGAMPAREVGVGHP